VTAQPAGPPGQPCTCPNLAGDCDGAHSAAVPDAAVTAADIGSYAEIILFEMLTDESQDEAGVTSAARRAAERVVNAAAPVIAAQAAAAERERLKPLIREKIAQLWVRQPFTSMTAEHMNAEVDTIVADLIRARNTA
jgi:hypothetical protein